MSKHRREELQPFAGRLAIAVRALLAIAAAGAAYLAWVSLSGGAAAGCGPESGCDRVLQSRWAYWLGLPVSGPAALLYALLFAATFRIGPNRSARQQQQAWRVLIPGATVVAGSAVWFVSLQIWAVGAFCPFCLAVHAAGFSAAVILWREARKFPKISKKAARSASVLHARSVRKLEWAGLAAVAALAVGQLAVQPTRFQVGRAAGVSSAGAVLELHKGSIRLNLRETPFHGNPEADHILVSLFDYTCHHCRDQHSRLAGAQRALGAQMGIASLVMPLDSECNPNVSRTAGAHELACEYARLSLAVWKAKPSTFAEFDDWLFEGPSPPPLEAARAKAEALTGVEALQTALESDWVSAQLRTNIAVYAANRRQVGSGQMPQLVIGSSVVTGPVESEKRLLSLIEEAFGIVPSP